MSDVRTQQGRDAPVPSRTGCVAGADSTTPFTTEEGRAKWNAVAEAMVNLIGAEDLEAWELEEASEGLFGQVSDGLCGALSTIEEQARTIERYEAALRRVASVGDTTFDFVRDALAATEGK